MGQRAEATDSLPRPGPIGRGVRLLLGVALLYFFAGIVRGFPELIDGIDLTNPLTWVGLGYALYAIPEVVGVAFSRAWRAQHVRGATGGLLLLAGVADLMLGGSPNGSAFGIASGLLLAFVLGVLGASFVVAAAVAAPG